MFESAICQILFYVFAVLSLLCAVGVVAFRNPVTSAMNMALCFGFVAAILFGLGAQFLGIVQIIVYAGAILVLFLFVVMMLDINDEDSCGCSDSSCKCCIGKAVHWLGSKMPVFSGLLVGCSLAAIISYTAISLPGATGNGCPCHALCNSVGELGLGDNTPAAAADVTAKGLGGVMPALSPAAAAKTLNPAIAPADAAKATSIPDVKLLGMTLFGKYVIPFVILGFALLSGTVGAVALSRKIRKA